MIVDDLPEPCRAHWSAFEAANELGLKERWKASLHGFLASMAEVAPDVRERFVIALARRFVDEGAQVPMRHPLFTGLVFPVLREGLDRRAPGCARWLAGFNQYIYQTPACVASLGPAWTERALFTLALEHDPGDDLARSRLIDVMARQFAYALHELPSGVLYGANGATPAECEALQRELAEFVRLVAQAGSSERYRPLIERGALHFTAYHEYLLANRREGYARFLEARSARASR